MARPSKTGIKGLHKNKDGRWCIDFRYRDPVTRVERRYTEDLPVGITAVAAKERARAALNAAYEGTLRANPEASMRLHTAIDKYVEWCETNRPKTIADRRYIADVLKRHMANMPLADLSAFAVERLKRSRAGDGVAPATVNRAMSVLKHMVGLASNWGWIPVEIVISVRSVRPLTEPPGRVRYLSDEETSQLLGTLREDVRLIVCAALMTGMRLGELAKLRKDAVNFGAALITLTHTKTNRVRSVPIHPALVEVLRAAIARSPGEYVFTNLAGRPHSHRASQIFRETVRRLGIHDLRFHDLRHDFATRLRMQGAGLDVIAKLLGHSTLAMAQRYAHIGLDLLRTAVDEIRAPHMRTEDRDVGDTEPDSIDASHSDNTT